MTFQDVIKKSFLKNIKKYLSYYFSGAFCVAMFFVYSTLVFLDRVKDADSEYPLKALFIVSCMTIFVFSIAFINYAHNMFIKNQKKELGVFMVVGMDDRSMRKMLAIETVIIGVAAILSGMIVGALFSRFFQTVIQKLLNIDNISYQIKPQSFLVTTLVFIVLYFFCYLITDRKMAKEDLYSMLKDKNKKEGKKFKKADIILFFVGIGLMIFSVLFIITVAGDDHINSSLWVLLTFVLSGYIGLFLVIVTGVKTFVWLIHKKNDYYKRMLSVSGIDHKFQQNSKIIVILSMMASMIVMLVGSPIALVSISGDIAEEGNSDLLYMVFSDYDHDKMNQVVEQKQIESRNQEQITYLPDMTTGELKPVLSVSQYNREMGTSLEVKKGQLYHLITSWEPGNHGVAPGDTYQLGAGEHAIPFTVCESIKGKWDYSRMFQTKSILLISDEDYSMIQPMLGTVEINQIMYVDNWRTTGPLIENVKNELKDEVGDQYFVSSILDYYKNIKSGYAVFLFTSCFMCFMFFVSTGFVLYFKQYNEIDDEKEQYSQLYKLGISDRVIKKSISAKLAVVYFLPLLGTIMGIMISYYLASIFGGNGKTFITMFISKAMIGVGCYVGSQLLFYLCLRAKYLHDIFQTEIA